MKANLKLEAALRYQKLGWSIIPVGKNKRPLIDSWLKYQKSSASEKQIRTWWAAFPNANPAVITGAGSGLVVLDIDAKHGRSISEFQIPPTPVSKTGGGGSHAFFKHPGHHVPSVSGKVFGVGVDIKADGGYVILPPSDHKSGNSYEWQIEPEDGLADMPEWFTEALEDYSDSGETDWNRVMDGFEDGERNYPSTQVLGKIFHDLSPELWETVGWESFKEWNKSNKPPIKEKELKGTFKWLLNKERRKKKNSNQEKKSKLKAGDVVRRIKDGGAILFHDEFEVPYIRMVVRDHKETLKCESIKFRNWVTREIYEKWELVPSTDMVKRIVQTLGAEAQLGEGEHLLSNRVAYHNEILWYDLSNEKWNAISITKNGWKIEEQPPIIFKRFVHQKKQVTPQSGGDVARIFEFVNIKKDHQKLLFLCLLLTYFIPGFPHPVIIPYGPQGSAKSTLFRIMRNLVDPSELELLSLPDNPSEVVQQLSHHWFIPYDNVTKITDKTSDALCRAVTGEGSSKRVLYSNDDDFIFKFKRCVGVNAITIMASRPDLLERSILIELERISEDDRKEEREFWDLFNYEKPMILGGIFDALVKAIGIYPTVNLKKKPRMADFARWGCALSIALGYSQEDFLKAYEENRLSQNEEALRENPVAAAILALMRQKKQWRGTATNLLTALVGVAEEEKIDMQDRRQWPSASNVLSKKLKEVKTNLEAAGIDVLDGGHREIVLTNKRWKGDENNDDHDDFVAL